MRKRSAALLLSGAMVAGGAGTAAFLTPASATTSGNPVTGRLAHLRSVLAGLVEDGTLTPAQADKVASTLDQALPKHAPGEPDGARPGGTDGPGFGRGLRGLGLGGSGMGGFGKVEAAAAAALHLSTDDLRTRLLSGTTLAQIAATQRVEVDTLVAALTQAATSDLAAQVEAGRLTRAQADAMAGSLTTRMTDLVTGSGRGPWTKPAKGSAHPVA